MARPKKTEDSVEVTEAPVETKLTTINQVKLAVSIPNTTSQTLHDRDFTLLYDSSKGCLYVQKKQTERGDGKENHPKFVIFNSNIAYMKL